MSRKIVPEGKESVKIELWADGAYQKAITVYVDQGSMLQFVDQVQSLLKGDMTSLKFKSMKGGNTKSITVPASLDKSLQVINKLF